MGGLLVLYVVFAVVMVALGVNASFVLVISAGMLWAQWYFSDSMALHAMRAREVTPEQAPQLHGIIDRLCVLADMPKPRDTFVLIRGAYDKKGEKVTPGTPAVLPPMPKDAPANRLGLARWLTDPQHPLVARVTVNRFWQQLFGVGVVKTTEDFGSQGEIPIHRELLDHLYGDDDSREANALEALVMRTRKKIGADQIETRRGFGYLMPDGPS